MDEGSKVREVVVVRLVGGVPGIGNEGGVRLLEEGVVGGEDDISFGDATMQC